MRVNSVFTSFLNHRLVVQSGSAILMAAIFVIASSFTNPSDRELRARKVNLIIRQIGHELLLQAGDQTSRVMPVMEIKEGTFILQFEKNLIFSHDSLMMLTNRLFPRTQFPSGYTVTVLECITASIVYGFQINNTSPDIMACQGRHEPEGCYTIEIAFPDLYNNAADKKTSIEPLTAEVESIKILPKRSPAKVKELETLVSDSDVLKLDGNLKTLYTNHKETNASLETSKSSTSGHRLIDLIYSSLLISLGVTLVIARFGKIATPKPVHAKDNIVTYDSVAEFAPLGKFRFDVQGQRLFLENEVISLTEKESRVLELLHKNFGELIARETLMQEIWINEGVITGRSLDMFVSKLRKKLSGDPALRITNVHGKGYRLHGE